MTRRRRLLAVLLVLVATGTAVFVVAFLAVLLTARLDQRRPVDAIVVLGAAQYNGRPSPVLRARLEHALALWRDGLAPWIVVTGGVGKGDALSEATVGRRWLRARGVPESALVTVPVGRSTEESMTAVASRLGRAGRRAVLLVSDPFHMARLRLEAKRTRLEAWVSPTDTSPISDNPTLELEYLLAEAFKVPVAWVKSLL